MNKNLLTRRNALKYSLATLAGIGTAIGGQAIYTNQQIQALDNPNRDFAIDQKKSLKEYAAAKGLIWGSAVRYDTLSAQPKFKQLFAQQCGILVPEWELKWSAGTKKLRPDAHSFDFKPADWMADFAAQHQMLFRGHTLVWHECLPHWFKEQVNNKNAAGLLTNHIQTVVGHYAGKIHSWDVVNEAIDINDQRIDGLRKTPWLEFLGIDYLDFAFRLAAQVDHQALLVYNDFGLDYDTTQDDTKRHAVLNLLQKLKSRGTPIHALGIQAHLSAHKFNHFSSAKFREFLRNVASLGLKIMITEMDVIDKNLPKNLLIRDRIVARIYEDYLSTALDEKAVIAVITWGLSDECTWISEFMPRADNEPVRPLPYDLNFQPKLAWNAIARAFVHAPKRYN